MLILWFVQVGLSFVAGGEALDWFVGFAVMGLCVYLGYCGNALSARHFIACGYEFTNPDSAEARIAAEYWGL